MNIKRIYHYGVIAAAVFAVMLVFMMSAESVRALSDPVIDENGITTWDCIYFGHYPQSSDGQGGFKVEPIKWRVLKVSGNDAFIMSDKSIDTVPYCAAENDPKYDCLWHVSTVRSWLNGYGADENQVKKDYSNDNFISRAFTEEDLKAVKTTKVITDKYTDWHYSWKDPNHYYMETSDKVYLLEYDEALDPKYGFTSDDEPTITRVSLNTAYTAAGGSYGDLYRNKEGEGDSWLLRSPGEYSMYADMFTEEGEYKEDISDVNPVNVSQGIRPVLHLDLSKKNVWKEAGTHSSLFPQEIRIAANFEKKYGDEPFDLGATCTGDGELTYASSDEDVASVDNSGKVTIHAAGTAVITVTAGKTSLYEEAVKTSVVNVAGESQDIVLPAEQISMTYGDAPVSLGAQAKTDIVYSSDNEKVATVDENGNVAAAGAGTCTITVKARAHEQFKPAYKYVTVNVEKAKPALSVSKKSATFKVKKLKKKAQTFQIKAKSSSGLKVTCKKKSGHKYLKISKTGKVTVKKGTKKGTYSMKVLLSTSANDKYEAASQTATIKVKVK